MSTDIPFGAHPPGGAPPTSVVQASSYFGAPSGSSPTDANPFHFAATNPPASAFAHATPSQPLGPSPSLQPLGPPNASNFFPQSNPNVNMFNPVAGGDDCGPQHQPAFAGDSFGVSSVATAPQPSMTSGPFADAAASQSSGYFSSMVTDSQMKYDVHSLDLSAKDQVSATSALGEEKGQNSYQRHSSAPSLPGASSMFGALPISQPGHSTDVFFSSDRPLSNSQDIQSRPSTVPRPYSHEPPSPVHSQPEAAVGAGSFSAPSTTLHQVLPASDHHHHQQQLQAASDHFQHNADETPSSTFSPTLRPPSSSGTVQGVFLPGAPTGQMTNADYSDSGLPLSMNPPGMLPNQVHPSLTEDLGITNASHSSQANLRTNASVEDVDVYSISAAIEDATAPDDVTRSAKQWSQSSPQQSQEGSSGQERSSSLNLDSKSVSSLLDGSQDDFSSYSPIRLLPPAPLGGEVSPQSHPASQTEQYSSNMTLPASIKGVGSGLQPAEKHESREPVLYTTEHGHEKKASDDLKDWEIVDSVPPASEVSQLPSSVRLLPPSSFASISSESGHLSNTSDASIVGTGISQAMQQLGLEHSQLGGSVVHPPQAHSDVLSQVPTGPSPPSSDGDKVSPASHLNTNYTNLEVAPAPHGLGYHQGHSEMHLSSNLPEPKEISSLITQIPFLAPVSASTTGTSTLLSLQGVSAATASSTSASSLQSGVINQPLLPPVSALPGAVINQPPPPPASALHRGGVNKPPSPPPPALHRGGVNKPPSPPPSALSGAVIHQPPPPPASALHGGIVNQPPPPPPSALLSEGITQPPPPDSSLQRKHQPLLDAEPSMVHAHSNLPPLQAVQLTDPAPPAAAGVDSTSQQFVAGTQETKSAPPLPLSTSAFAQVHQPQQQHEQMVGSSNPNGRPGVHTQQPPLPQQSLPGAPSTSLPPPPSLIGQPARSLEQSGSGAQQAQPSLTTSNLQPAVHPPVGDHFPSQTSNPQTTSHSQPPQQSQLHQPAQPPLVTTGVESATSSAQVAPRYPEERREGPQHHHHPSDDHGYHQHDPYYPSDRDRDRDPYYSGPRERYRAPSEAFSEREVDPYHHGYHSHRPESRPRYDYSHYPDHPVDSGYRYGHHGPTYGGDDPYRRGGYPPLYGRPPVQDEYGMPVRPPYYDPYDSYRYRHHHGYGGHYPPPPSGYYGSEYPPEHPYDYYEHDSRPHPESGYGSHGYPQPSYGDTYEELPPAEASAIGGQSDNFEVSQFVASPNARFPGRPHPQELQHNSTAYLDPQQDQMGYPSQHDQQYHHSEHGYPHTDQGYEQVSDVHVRYT